MPSLRCCAGLLEKIAEATAAYLRAQIEAGASVVQLFDTWAGELSRGEYDEFELPATQHCDCGTRSNECAGDSLREEFGALY